MIYILVDASLYVFGRWWPGGGGGVVCCVEVGYNGFLGLSGGTWLTCDLVDMFTNVRLSYFVDKEVGCLCH